MTITPAIAIHLSAAVGALLLGGLMLAARKGTLSHRLLGRFWVALMAATALSSFWIKTHGHFSWIHLLSIWVLFILIKALVSIYRGNIRAHRRWVTSAYIGLVGAGVFTLLPHRLVGGMVANAIGMI